MSDFLIDGAKSNKETLIKVFTMDVLLLLDQIWIYFKRNYKYWWKFNNKHIDDTLETSCGIFLNVLITIKDSIKMTRITPEFRFLEKRVRKI